MRCHPALATPRRAAPAGPQPLGCAAALLRCRQPVLGKRHGIGVAWRCGWGDLTASEAFADRGPSRGKGLGLAEPLSHSFTTEPEDEQRAPLSEKVIPNDVPVRLLNYHSM